MQAGRGLTH